MILEIISQSSKSTINVNWVEVNTYTGNFVIQAGHAPTIISLEPEKELIFEHVDGEQERIIIPSGIIHITRTCITLIISSNIPQQNS
ncbi:MAG TPA: hypothetical protein VJ201_02580 [Candidatus Babeliales bacterium]|nr:hypothetical protein [Candidatus Babeliales bacterium]